MYYDRAGQPIDMARWLGLCHDDQYKRVAHTPIAPEIEVSTVWLGLDHSHGSGPPLIFETMVFGGALEQECRRYPTEAAALAGHHEIVTLARADLEFSN